MVCLRHPSVIGSSGRCGEPELLQVSQIVGGHEPNTRHPSSVSQHPEHTSLSQTTQKTPHTIYAAHTHHTHHTMASRALSMPARRLATAGLSTPAMTRRSFQSSARLLEVPVGAMPVRKPVGAFRGGYGASSLSSPPLNHLPVSVPSTFRLPCLF